MECWTNIKQNIHNISVPKMRMLRWMCDKTTKDKVRNEDIHLQVGIAPIKDKLNENRLRWFGYIRHRSRDAPVRRME